MSAAEIIQKLFSLRIIGVCFFGLPELARVMPPGAAGTRIPEKRMQHFVVNNIPYGIGWDIRRVQQWTQSDRIMDGIIMAQPPAALAKPPAYSFDFNLIIEVPIVQLAVNLPH